MWTTNYNKVQTVKPIKESMQTRRTPDFYYPDAISLSPKNPRLAGYMLTGNRSKFSETD